MKDLRALHPFHIIKVTVTSLQTYLDKKITEGMIDLTGLCQPSASLCLSHNRETQTEQHTICGYTLGQSALFANANSIVASCHPGTQKKDVGFHMNQNRPIVHKLVTNL